MDTDLLYLALAEKNNCMIVYEKRKGKNGKCYAAKTTTIRSLQTLAAIFSPEVMCSTQKTRYKKTWIVQGKLSMH